MPKTTRLVRHPGGPVAGSLKAGLQFWWTRLGRKERSLLFFRCGILSLSVSRPQLGLGLHNSNLERALRMIYHLNLSLKGMASIRS